MLAEILTWGFIAAVYIAAIGIIALPKHWYRLAQTLFLCATVLADVKLAHWAITSSRNENLRASCLLLGLMATTFAAIWFVRKVEADIRADLTAKEHSNDKTEFIIRQLEGFITEERQITRIGDGSLAGSLAGFGEMFTFRGKVEHFLGLHLSNEHVIRFQKKGVYALQEMIKELIDGGTIPRSRNDAVEEIRPFYDLLAAREKRVLRFILPLHRSPTNLNVGQLIALENIQKKTGFVARNYTTGSYELNEKVFEALKLLLPLDAGLYGKIICREIKLVLNAKDEHYTCFFILQVRLSNDGPPAMVTHWQFDLYWQGVEYPSVRQPVADYYVKRPIKHADDPSITFEKRPLIEFPADEEITSANQKLGWLHFSVGAIPIDAVSDFGHLHKDFTLKLQVFDNKEAGHVIYEGPNEGLSGCGTIERPKN